MRTPNAEQKKAIEHSGGVILKAGAGSGKTFVLVEHVVHLINDFIGKNKDKNKEEFSRVLASFLSKIVLMTFTKKAAGELETRIRVKVNSLAGENKLWELARDQLGHLNISTIHGFCHKLLTQGYITSLSPDIEIISDIEYKSKIEELIDDGLASKQLSEEFDDLIYGHKREIISSFFYIFQSPELRKLWAASPNDGPPSIPLHDFLKTMMGLLNIADSGAIDFDSYKQFAGKKWYDNLKSFYELEKSSPLKDLESLKKIAVELKKRAAPIKTKEDVGPLKDYYIRLKKFKEFFKLQETILAYYEGDKSFFDKWYLLLKELFDHIELKIPFFHGLNYSDLEYYTLKGLEIPEIAKKIRNNYTYFIVDEFQDTSPGQFEIINHLINNDFNNLFCVGDLKQAIYGFRGGEIAVFKKCEKLMPKTLTLSNNYRSQEKIINFCNDFFKLIFSLDAKLENRVSPPFEIEPQVCPDPQDLGGVIRTLVKVDDTNKMGKPGKSEFEIIEAVSILKRVEEIQKDHPGEEICILYRMLAPSRYLISFLLEDKKVFLAQVKIPYNEDPVLGIFKVLLECHLNNDEKVTLAYYEVLVEGYLKHLNFPIPGNLVEFLKVFNSDLQIIGTLEAFRKFFFSLGISNSNHTHNMGHLSSLININAEDLELIWIQMGIDRSATYSFEFQLGRGGANLKIMTVHSSKGLEFDHVILGGIHTLRKGGGARPIMGKGPTALMWKEESKQGKFYYSPGYLLEKEIESLKESSESKRLLYVACTRAKNSLSWMDIVIGDEPAFSGAESWIQALRQIESEIFTTNTLCMDITDVYKHGEMLQTKTPFFHQGAQGMASKVGHTIDHKLGTISELSVTRLATLLDCPRKFYLQNICRLEDGDLDRFYEDEEEVDIKSSSKRGTRIHAIISTMLELGEIKNINSEDQAAVDFAKDSLAPLKNKAELISEKQIKFPLFGFMCSGIPDLMVIPKSSDINFKIIDFKTGKSSDSYWFQLSCYAYAAYYLNLFDKTREIDLELYYLDEQKILTKTLDYEQLKTSLFSTWEKLNNLSQVNVDHCPTCRFRNMCYPSTPGRPSYDKINPEI
ncbi:MAG: hypothetical protein DRQ88_12125 [Epsilonproteobacteria bacterium]|nr:MAG: hypothetical protein DRQ88_12125 [Campylobacterota bacterium]RLA64704.1 MAG: hypothetical protein DRQ89_03315 [Campylobacterota bacterium]